MPPPLTRAQKAFLCNILGLPEMLFGAEGNACAPEVAKPFSPYGAPIFRPDRPDPMTMRPDEKPAPPPPPPIPRATVLAALKDFLGALRTAQKTRDSVAVTDVVVQAGAALTDGLQEAGTQMSSVVRKGDHADPDELATRMAAVLPDAIPAENYGRFLAKTGVASAAPKKPTLGERARDAVRDKLDKVGKPPQGGDSPADDARPPGGVQSPASGSRPGEHTGSTPDIPIPGT